ncbi:hypothetical protein [Paenibacillus silviterrae]|uniref:hypothetical protein n=1 Tax=Paenibacillus silviterrae TaxID=3242194 RepID=UPI0025435609|nr:hypothetical protein [Paenibacillus chinjuensis]
MRNSWYRNVTAALVAGSLLVAAVHPMNAVLGENAAVAQGASFQLTETVVAEVKSVVNERTADGMRLGAVVKLSNQGKQLTRVPDYEVRLRSKDGVEYILQPSTLNPTAIQPLESVELQYMMMVETTSLISLDYLAWVDSDWDVYPKVEKEKLRIPIETKVWTGLSESNRGEASAYPWGKPFALPELADGLLFTPIGSYRQVGTQGPVTIISLLVENTGSQEVTLPKLLLDGRAGSKVYKGARAGKTPERLAPQGKQYLYFAIPAEGNVELESAAVLTENTFQSGAQKTITYQVGWLTLQLPKAESTAAWFGRLPSYGLNQPIFLDLMHSLIHPNVEMSLVEMHLLEERGKNYKAVNAKLKLTNKGDSPLPLPSFRAELVNTQGLSYTGNRVGTTAETLLPQFGYIMNYTFVIPAEETGENLALRILDTKAVEPYSLPVGGFRAKVQQGGLNEDFDLYPFRIRLKDYYLQSTFNTGVFTLTMKAKLNLELEQEERVLADQGLSHLKLELTDATGKIIGSGSLPLTGENRIRNGENIIKLGEIDHSSSGLTLHIYEAVETPFGEALRLLRVLKQ